MEVYLTTLNLNLLDICVFFNDVICCDVSYDVIDVMNNEIARSAGLVKQCGS